MPGSSPQDPIKKRPPRVAELACVIVNDPFVTALTYIAPLPISIAALAEAVVRIGVEPCAQFAVVTIVVADPVASVTLPTAFDRPAARCCRTARSS
jgi:hypothetical protein